MRKLRDNRSLTVAALFAFCLLALVLRIEAARPPSIAYPDEIFQTIEPAHRLAFGYGVVTWEWRDGIRSWVFPAFLALIMRSTAWFGSNSVGSNPAAYLTAIVFVLSLLSLSAIWFAFAWAKRASGMAAGIVAAGACAIWYELVIFAPRAFSEVVAAHVLLPGLYLGAYGDRMDLHSMGLHSMDLRRRMFLAGLFCGLAVSLREQLAPAVALALLYFCHFDWRKRWLPLTAGAALPVIAFGIVDLFTWSHPFQSFYLYFVAQFVHGRSATFGVQPWYWYLAVLAQHLGLILPFAFAGARRSPLLAWIVLAIVVSHSAIPHKEVRFIYPAVPLLITLAAIGMVEAARWIGERWQTPLPSGGVATACLAFFAFHSIYFAPQFDYWSKDSGTLYAFDQLSRDAAVCGVGLGVPDWYNGGYAHLHHNVPIVLLQQEADVGRLAPSFNVLVRPGLGAAAGFELANCRSGVCWYRRAGSCQPPPQNYELNTALRLSGN